MTRVWSPSHPKEVEFGPYYVKLWFLFLGFESYQAFLFNLKSGHRYGILARVWSPSDPEEVDAASSKATQGHLLHVEQAEYGLDETDGQNNQVPLTSEEVGWENEPLQSGSFDFDWF